LVLERFFCGFYVDNSLCFHCHALCTDGGFYGKGMFRVAPWFIPKDLEKLFRYKVFKMLLSRKKITEDLIEMMMGWRHSGFNVYCGPRIQPGEEEAMENLARYIIRASFSQERMTYIPEESRVLYRSKDGKKDVDPEYPADLSV